LVGLRLCLRFSLSFGLGLRGRLRAGLGLGLRVLEGFTTNGRDMGGGTNDGVGGQRRRGTLRSFDLFFGFGDLGLRLL
jgi:hypothetical protein